MRTNPGYLAMRTSPGYLAMKTSHNYLAMRTSPSFLAMQISPSYQAMRTSPTYLAMQISPGYLAMKTSPSYLAIQTSLSYVAIKNSPSYLVMVSSTTGSSKRTSPSFLAMASSTTATWLWWAVPLVAGEGPGPTLPPHPDRDTEPGSALHHWSSDDPSSRTEEGRGIGWSDFGKRSGANCAKYSFKCCFLLVSWRRASENVKITKQQNIFKPAPGGNVFFNF